MPADHIPNTKSVKSLWDLPAVHEAHLVYGRYQCFCPVSGKQFYGVWVFHYYNDGEIATHLGSPSSLEEALPRTVHHDGNTLFLKEFCHNSVEASIRENELVGRQPLAVNVGRKFWTAFDQTKHPELLTPVIRELPSSI